MTRKYTKRKAKLAYNSITETGAAVHTEPQAPYNAVKTPAMPLPPFFWVFFEDGTAYRVKTAVVADKMKSLGVEWDGANDSILRFASTMMHWSELRKHSMAWQRRKNMDIEKAWPTARKTTDPKEA